MNDSSEKQNVIKVKAFDLLEGNAKRFQPFLGNLTGAVKLKYKGSKSIIKVHMEVWENGEKKDTSYSTLSSAIQESKNGVRVMDSELIMSVNQQVDQTGANKSLFQVIAALSEPNSSTSMNYEFASDNEASISMPLVLGKDELTFSENEEVAVWGIQVSNGSIENSDLSPETLRKVQWGIIFKLSLED